MTIALLPEANSLSSAFRGETMINGEKGSSETNRDILQAYRAANEIAQKSHNPDEEIAAYNDVINLGLNRPGGDDVKRNMIMYWAYNNIGDALMNKSVNREAHAVDARAFNASVESYLNSLHFARDNLEKISVLNRIAENYKYLGDEFKWCEYKEKMIANMRPEEKREAYAELAHELKNTDLAIDIYNEALNFVSAEEVSFFAKCLNTLEICEILLRLYQQKNDTANVNRIKDLMAKTVLLGVEILEERQDEEDDEEKRLQAFVKQMEFENKYAHPDVLRQKCLLRRLLEILGDREVQINGEVYNRGNIRKKLRKIR